MLESDGYLLDRFKAFYNRLYGTLTFVEDHGRQQNCEAVGHGDSGIYPGAAVETGVQRPAGTRARYIQEIRWCDMHHNLAGYSGTNGNAVWVHDNDIYDNSLGIQTDVVTGAGHPGYPGDSMVVEDNRVYSNNLNTYDPASDIEPSFPFPVGTGLWIAGGNHHVIRNNHVYDNWRRGTMVFSVPDSLVCGPAADGNEQAGCDASQVSTSHYNAQHDNLMGVRPDGTPDRNGTDFWWDDFPGSRGNCWFRNSGPIEITTSPSRLPDCADGRDPALSLGKGNPQNEGELISCAVVFETRDFDPNGPCPWMRPPSDPDAGGGGGGSTLPTPALDPRFSPVAVTSAAALPLDDLPLGLLSCRHYMGAGDAQRGEMIADVARFAGGTVVTGEEAVGTGAVLSATEARALFDGWCVRSYADGFLLYKLYTHAAAFARRLG